MRVGIVILPEHRWPQARRRWMAAEEFGFDHAFTYDHLGWRTLVDGPWFDAVPTLASAAVVTERIGLGTLVASPNFRHPVSFARQLTTLDDLSGGRFTLGIGSGGGGVGGYDNVVLGAPEPSPARRSARFAEFLELTDRLLREPVVSYAGEHYTAVQARNAPGCVQRPRLPMLVAANGPKAMRLAAQYGDGWLTTGVPSAVDSQDDTVDGWWRRIADASARFDDALTAQRRDPAEVRRVVSVDAGPVFSLSSVGAFTDAVGRAADLGFTDVVTHWPRPDGVYAGREETLEAVAADVLPTLAAGQE